MEPLIHARISAADLLGDHLAQGDLGDAAVPSFINLNRGSDLLITPRIFPSHDSPRSARAIHRRWARAMVSFLALAHDPRAHARRPKCRRRLGRPATSSDARSWSTRLAS